MQLHIYFTPTDVAAVAPTADDIYIVIDLIRATTSITVLLERGAARIFVANTLEQAQQAAELHPGRLLCGERNALPLPGFDYGNSPAQFSQLDLGGRELILTTTNGSRAFYACPAQSVRLAGCFYNARAVTTHALALARQRDCNIAIVCAAEAHYFALDDSTCAGYLALELQRLNPALECHESVSAATTLYATYPPPSLGDHCRSAQSVIAVGLGADIDLCMQQNKSSIVPMVTGSEQETGLLIIERAPQ
ncbi:MAG TPA: 2-phosphosulfolactate phosphatase [Ktedonobacteraceae bacterium]|nr:2-phosphosulfolactate phosphatase [Ktedonobacteraceae bacterium]